MAAFRAMVSMAEPVANALNNSETNNFPAFPKGTLKIFFFQCTASAWIKLRVVSLSCTGPR